MQSNTHVMIVGAGPVGLLAALDLVSRGIQATVVDENEQADARSLAVVPARSARMRATVGVHSVESFGGHSERAFSVMLGRFAPLGNLTQRDSDTTLVEPPTASFAVMLRRLAREVRR